MCRWCVRSASWRTSAPSTPARRPLYEADFLSELGKGVPLSDAMESCAPAFPTLLLAAMIRSAEGTGSIDHACARMATYYEREHKMNQQVGNSMMYPIILSVLIVGVIAILMTFVLPQFKPMFDQMETLPFLTQLLFDVSDFVGANWPVLLVGGAHRLWRQAPAGAAEGPPPVGPLHPARAGGRRVEPQDLHGTLCQHAVQPVRQRRASSRHRPRHATPSATAGSSQFGDALTASAQATACRRRLRASTVLK